MKWLVTIIIVLVTTAAVAGTLSLTWDAPTTYNDDTPITAGTDTLTYTLYASGSTGTTGMYAIATGITPTQYIVGFRGTVYFMVTATSSSLSAESDFSNAVSGYFERFVSGISGNNKRVSSIGSAAKRISNIVQ